MCFVRQEIRVRQNKQETKAWKQIVSNQKQGQLRLPFLRFGICVTVGSLLSPLSSAFVPLFVSSRDGHTNTGGILVRAKTTARSGFAASCVRLRPKRGRGRHQTTQDERENLGLGCDDSLDFLIWCPSDLGKIQSTFNAGFVILPS